MSDLDFSDEEWDMIRMAVDIFPEVKRIIDYLMEPAYCYLDMREDEIGRDGMEAIEQIEKLVLKR